MQTVHSFTGSIIAAHIEARKDVFYRLKNNTAICWRMILWLFSVKFISIAERHGGQQFGSVKCLIFDDSSLTKTGKKIEMVSRIWDHTFHRYLLRFKLLAMVYWDGLSTIPLDFSLHREKGRNIDKPYGLKKKELKRQYKKKRKSGTHSQERADEADISKIKSAKKMFWRAISQGIKVDYLLMDSWFTCEAFIEAVRKVKKQTVHLIGMYKTPKTKFVYQDQKLTHAQIRNKLGKAKRCRKLRLHYKETIVDYNGSPIKMFFSRQGKNGKWKVFITTNMELSFIQMVEIYQIRWTIEVFFKESKQLLGLGKCQSNDFDAQIADITITMIQYILLSLRYRFEHYESKGALFNHMKEGIIQERLNERLWGLFIELLRLIEALFEEVDEVDLLEKIFNDEKAFDMINRWFQFGLEMKNVA